MIQRTQACLIISRALKIFGPRTHAETWKSAVRHADEELANWFLQLPDSLRFHPSNQDIWAAILTLTYHNILILLHRPAHPSRKGFGQMTLLSTVDLSANPHDAEICNASSSAIVSIFETICSKRQVQNLWLDSVNALFTALTHLSVQIESTSPVIAVNARRQFDSGLRSLKVVAEWWPIEQAVVELFESESERTPGRLDHDASIESATPVPVESHSDNIHYGIHNTPFTGPIHQQTDGISALLVASAEAASPSLQRNNIFHTHTYAPSILSPQQSVPDDGLYSADASLPDWRQLFPFTETDQLRLFENQQFQDGYGVNAMFSSHQH